MPRRRTGYRRLRVSSTDTEQQRRAVLAVAALIVVVVVLGAVVWYLGPFRDETPVDRTSEAQAALTAAAGNANQVFGPANLLTTDPAGARILLEEAWDDLERARDGVAESSWTPVHDQVASGLDELYATYMATGSRIYSAPDGQTVTGLVSGPDDAAYAIVGASVMRIDSATNAAVAIVTSGQGSGQGIGQPRLLARGGPDLLILDANGSLWRWRPSDALGAGTLGQVRVAGEQTWGADVVDIETFVINPDQGLYRMYVPYPSSSQVLRYEPTADGSGFSAPAPYFVGDSEDVAAFHQLLIDGDVYAVTSPDVLRYFNGRQTSWSLDEPPDGANLRPQHDYRLIAATGTRGVGQLYVWDATWSRILVYDKADATYVEQFLAAPGEAAFADISGMYLIDRGQVQAPILVWARPDGIFQVELAEPTSSPTATPSPSARPSSQPSAASPSPPASASSPSAPAASETPTDSTPPTTRPRRTPRPGGATASP